MEETVVVVLPLPNRVLSPNFPCASFRGRMMRAAAARKQRTLAKAAAEQSACGMKWQSASVVARFYHAKKRRRDDVNALAMLKSAWDGIVDSGLIPDDDATHLHTKGAEFFTDAECPRVEIELTRES